MEEYEYQNRQAIEEYEKKQQNIQIMIGLGGLIFIGIVSYFFGAAMRDGCDRHSHDDRPSVGKKVIVDGIEYELK